MKKLFLSLICLLALTASFAAPIATPVPGVNIVIKRNSGGSTLNARPTDEAGKMSVRTEAGRYEVSVSYDQVMAAVAKMDKNKTANSCYKIQLSIDPDTLPGITVNGDTLPRTIEITKTTGNIMLAVPAKGATIRFTLTWDSCKK